MGEVFRAYDTRARRVVALKVLRTINAAAASSLEHEATVQKQLRHPNIIEVVDFGVVDEVPYIALEFVDGPTLAAVMTNEKLPVATALSIVAAIANALAYAHEARDANGVALGVVHRDISPQNVMLTRDGVVKLGDFGIARVRGDTRTRTGSIRGKLAYLAPEQVTQSTVDQRTDIYQLGLILFELLTGEPYLTGERDVDVLRLAEAPPVRKPSELNADARLDALVMRALRRFPEERFQSARQLAAALNAAQRQFGTPSFHFIDRYCEPVPLARRGRRGGFVGLAALLLIAGLGTVAWRRAHQMTEAAAVTQVAEQMASPSEVAPTRAAPLTPAPPQTAKLRERGAGSRQTTRSVAQLDTAPAAATDNVADAQPVAPSCLADALARARGRHVALIDLDPTLRARIDGAIATSAKTDDTLCEAIDNAPIDRAYVQRKLDRLRARLAQLDNRDPRWDSAQHLTRQTLQQLLDGNIVATNASLVALDTLLERAAL